MLAAILAAVLGSPLAPTFAGGAHASLFIEPVYAHGYEDAISSQWKDGGKR
jgi:hypothetical protein